MVKETMRGDWKMEKRNLASMGKVRVRSTLLSISSGVMPIREWIPKRACVCDIVIRDEFGFACVHFKLPAKFDFD